MVTSDVAGRGKESLSVLQSPWVGCGGGRWAGFWVKKTIHAKSRLHEELHPGRGHATRPAVLQPLGSPPAPRSPPLSQLRVHTRWRCAQPKTSVPSLPCSYAWPGDEFQVTSQVELYQGFLQPLLLSWFRGVTRSSFAFFFVLAGTRGEAKGGATILWPQGI